MTSVRKLVLASQKGGAGKTTLTAHIAVEAERLGFGPVALIDTDPQQGLTGWWKVRPGESLLMARMHKGGIKETLTELEDMGVKLVVIDTPPAITTSIRDTVRQANLVIIPVKPSPHDLRAVGATVDIVEGEHKPAVFVINQATTRTKIKADAVMSLSQHGTIAPVALHHRVDFASSMSDGGVVIEHDPKSKSAAEVTALWAYIIERLERNERNGAATPA